MASDSTEIPQSTHSRLLDLRPPGLELNYEAWQAGRLDASVTESLCKDLVRHNNSLMAFLPDDELALVAACPSPCSLDRLLNILTDVEEMIVARIDDGELTLEQLPRLDWPDALAQGIP